MQRASFGSIVVLVALGVPGAGWAQERPGAIYLTATATVPRGEGVTGTSSQTYATAPGGWTRGWAVGGGVFVSRHASVEVELSRTGVMRATEPSRYDMTFHEERRDTFLTFGIRLHARPGRAVDLEPVVGFDLVYGDAWSQVDYDHPYGTPYTTPRYRQDLATVAGFSTGLDVRAGGRHAAAVVSFRLHRTYRGNDYRSEYPGSDEQAWTIRPGAGVRFDF